MTLQQLEYFSIVAKYGNMTKAANELHISQPSLSECIKKLETEIGVQLFDRVGKNIVLNENGNAFLKSSNSIFEIIERNKQKMLYGKSLAHEEIVIGFRCTESLLAPCISQYYKHHKKVIFRLVTNMNVVRQEGSAVLDFLIARGINSHSGRFCVPLIREEHCVLLRKDHPLAQSDSIDLRDLSEDTFIFCAPKSSKMPSGYTKCINADFAPKIAMIIDDRFAFWALIREGRYTAILPYSDGALLDGKDGYVCRRIKGEENNTRTVYLSWKNKEDMSDTAQDFLLFLLREFQVNESDAVYV